MHVYSVLSIFFFFKFGICSPFGPTATQTIKKWDFSRQMVDVLRHNEKW
jgi:hypothetical protein